MAEFVTVATTDEIPPGERLVVEIDDVWVVIFNVGGQYYALEDMCSHEEYYLSEGALDGYALECAKHGAQFDVRRRAIHHRFGSIAKQVDEDLLDLLRVRPNTEPCFVTLHIQSDAPGLQLL